MKLAVIPARGGSERIPKKNIKQFCGKPIMAFSIEAALKSGVFDKIIVSTDDDSIARVALNYGAEVPFKRPHTLSDEYTGTLPVVQHAIEWYEEKGVYFEKICCIYATAPFINSDDIIRGLEKLECEEADFIISVTSFPFPIQRAVRKNTNGFLEMVSPEMYSVRSQDLETLYHDAGQFYWASRNAWLIATNPYQLRTKPLILPRTRVQDIDTLEDWECAEKLFYINNNHH